MLNHIEQHGHKERVLTPFFEPSYYTVDLSVPKAYAKENTVIA
jgi:hypothetical protein